MGLLPRQVANGLFQSTLPVWGATAAVWLSPRTEYRISIHAPRVGSDWIGSADGYADGISIHAPRVGSDRFRLAVLERQVISIHAPRVGSDVRPLDGRLCGLQFQSTLPVWGATMARTGSAAPHQISIHAPRVGSDGRLPGRPPPAAISIHAPRVGSDRSGQFRQLLRGISIHAPRVGSDSATSFRLSTLGDFNPRSPCGERRGSPESSPRH